jgi:hypothetical protein
MPLSHSRARQGSRTTRGKKKKNREKRYETKSAFADVKWRGKTGGDGDGDGGGEGEGGGGGGGGGAGGGGGYPVLVNISHSPRCSSACLLLFLSTSLQLRMPFLLNVRCVCVSGANRTITVYAPSKAESIKLMTEIT